MRKIFLMLVVVICGVNFCFADRLSKAIVAGDLEKVKSCIEEQRIDVNRVEDKDTPLMTALYMPEFCWELPEDSAAKKIEIVKYLISKGADVNYSYKNYFKGNIDASCLDYVIYESRRFGWYYTELFKLLYKNGAKISDYSLRWAVGVANDEIIDILIKSGKITRKMYTDTLYWVVDNVSVPNYSGIDIDDAIKYIGVLAKKGADINYKDSSGLSPLMLSVVRCLGEMDTRIMKCLVDNGADINITDKDGNTVIMKCSFEYYNKYADKIGVYLSAKPNLNIKNKKRETVISKLISTHYGKPGYSNYDNTQDLEKLFEKFKELGANFLDNDVDTPYIILATDHKKNNIVKYLIGLGADVTVKDKKGKDALYYAYDSEDQELINMLKNPEPVRLAEKKKREDFSKMEVLIKHKDFEELKTIMDNYGLTSSYILPNGKTIYDTVFSNFINDQSGLYIDYLIEEKNYSNVAIVFNEVESRWYYSIDSFEKRIDSFEDIQSNDLRDYLKEEIDERFDQNYQNIKRKKSANKIYYSYIDSNFDSVLIRLIKEKDQKTANNMITQCLCDLKYVNAEGKTALDYAIEYGLKSVRKNIEQKLQ